jgi:hypothetical protein
MIKVFIGGSISITSLPEIVKVRIDGIVSKGFSILIGDASGVDSVVQAYLAQNRYANVVVYCVGQARNLLMPWTIHAIATNKTMDKLSRTDYALKDEVMAKEADYGFMIWDGRSSGTVNNMLNLISQGKKCLVFFSRSQEFFTLYDAISLGKLFSQADDSSLAIIDKKVSLQKRMAELRKKVLFVHENSTKYDA